MSQEEIDNNFSFEKKKHLEFFLPYYEKMGWSVIDDSTKRNEKDEGWDVKLKLPDERIVLVDEKALRKEWNNCLVELIQDLKTKSWGWFFYGEKDWVLYGSWNVIEKTSEKEPNSLYLINMPKLRDYVCSLERIIRTVISHKGWGITWNINLSWTELINKEVAIRLSTKLSKPKSPSCPRLGCGSNDTRHTNTDGRILWYECDKCGKSFNSDQINK